VGLRRRDRRSVPSIMTLATIFDCTVPVDLLERFERARFAEVDLSGYEGLEHVT
jgi:hypothetical protein